MIKKNKIASRIFLVLVLFNLLFPPNICIEDGIIYYRNYFKFIFGSRDEIDIPTLVVLILISLIVSIIIQGIYNIIKKKQSKNNKTELVDKINKN